MPELKDSATLAWSESGGDLEGTVQGDVSVDSVTVANGGTIGSATTTDAVTIASGGNVTLVENLILASGKGIDFSATSDASGSTSELLDDYEEGTWTPAFEANIGSFTTMSYDIQLGRYIKIGGVVTAWGRLRTDDVDVTGASGDLNITGLPYTASTLLNEEAPGSVAVGTGAPWGVNAPQFIRAASGLSFMSLHHYATTNVDQIQVSDLSTGSGSQNSVSWAVTYRVY